MSKTRQTTLDVSGMTCRSCVSHVNAALRELEGVSKIDVQLREGKVVVMHDEGAAPADKLIEALEEVGYPARASA